jgi:hypothetical protein
VLLSARSSDGLISSGPAGQNPEARLGNVVSAILIAFSAWPMPHIDRATEVREMPALQATVSGWDHAPRPGIDHPEERKR